MLAQACLTAGRELTLASDAKVDHGPFAQAAAVALDAAARR